MKLGFYYHIPVNSISKKLKIPAYLGVFLDALAKEVDKLILFMHKANEDDVKYCDYVLRSHNIEYCSLGAKTPAWERFLFPWRTLKKIKNKITECDTLLVRAPTPLAPAFYNQFREKTRLIYLIVGDYVDGAKYLNQPLWRKIPIIILSNINDRQLSRVAKHTITLVNSQKLYEKYKLVTPDLHLVKTTTLSDDDFFYREDTCQGDEVKLLYTGSLSFAKGLRELIDAFAILYQKRENISLHLVGWDYDPGKSTEKYLKSQTEKYGIANKIFFHGYKTVGPELNAMYRMADIYIIPSSHEGFPRSIWEAMANGLPVIATAVGSIPYYLTNNESAILIEAKNYQAIAVAVEALLIHSDLRKKLITNGYLLAKEHTLDKQVKNMITILKKNQ